jgi:tripartite-type tricarboxylate transporter receptor subunit TctC
MTDDQKQKLSDAVDTLTESEAFRDDMEQANAHSVASDLRLFKEVLLRGDYDDALS